MENLDPPLSPNQEWENGAFCPSRGFILDLWGMGVCCSILLCPRLKAECFHLFYWYDQHCERYMNQLITDADQLCDEK